MKLRFPLTALLLAAIPILAASSGPDSRTATDPKSVASQANASAKPIAVDDLFQITGISRGSWSPNGQDIVFGSNASGRANLWTMHANGGGATQLTKSDDRDTGATYSPDGKWIVYTQDRGGNEIWDLYAVPSVGGAPMDLTGAMPR